MALLSIQNGHLLTHTDATLKVWSCYQNTKLLIDNEVVFKTTFSAFSPYLIQGQSIFFYWQLFMPEQVLFNILNSELMTSLTHSLVLKSDDQNLKMHKLHNKWPKQIFLTL